MITDKQSLINDPVLIFTTILFVVLIVPLFLRHSKIPSIVGLIIAGFLLGPHAFMVIGHSEIMELFSQVGLLYLMFLAGLEVEIIQFRRTGLQNLVFGVLSFFIPFVLAYLIGNYLFSWSLVPTILFAIMLASNTLVAFPIAERYGITRSLAVNVAIGGTIIADTLVLLILAMVTSLQINYESSFLWSFAIPFLIYLLVIFFGIPLIARWFFSSIPADNKIQFLFALTIMFAASFGAELAGAEPIIGAFFSGLVLNKAIPQTSPLMNRINFVGNTLFVPVFLIGVGMLLDLVIVFSSLTAILYAVLLIGIALTGKWLAAKVVSFIFVLNKAEMYIIFGLSSARAAATLAIALIGVEFHLIGEDLFNAIMVMIIVTSLFSSFVTDKYGKIMAMRGEGIAPQKPQHGQCRILIPLSNPKTAAKLMEMAVFIKSPDVSEPVFPLSVIKDDAEARKNIVSQKSLINQITANASELGINIQGLTRIDVSVPVAIVRATKELMIDKIVMGWSGQSSEIRRVFGNMLEYVVLESLSELFVCNFPFPIITSKKILVIVPPNAEAEPGFKGWMDSLTNLHSQIQANFSFRASDKTYSAIKKLLQLSGMSGASERQNQPPGLSNIKPDDFNLVVIINARPQSISYLHEFWKLTYRMPESLLNKNFVMVYPGLSVSD